MSNALIGQIVQYGFNFAPRNWATCSGQLVSIAQNTALFSILGTTYGGNGQTTFALPDLRGRTMVHWGNGPGLSPYSLGEVGGNESVALTLSNLPTHNHGASYAATTPNPPLNGASIKATAAAPSTGAVLARGVDGADTPTARPVIYAPAGTTPTVPLGGVNLAGTVVVGNAGGSQPHDNLSPYLTVNPCICMFGIFPSRN